MTEDETRANEWYVPRFGPRRFRLLVGLSFYPYSLMNASYVFLGSMLAPSVQVDRALGMSLVYLLAVGVTAHSLDALAPNKPWGNFLTRRQLAALAAAGLLPALLLGLYYALFYSLWLIPLGLLELFFLLAYNLESFGGVFHTDRWFAFSWGFLPVLAGYLVQANSLGPVALIGGLFGFSTAYLEISASRPYKALKKRSDPAETAVAQKLESVLKAVVSTSVLVAVLLYALRFLW